MTTVFTVLLIAVVLWICLILLALPVLAAIMRSSQISREAERADSLGAEGNKDSGGEREDNNS